MFRQLLQHELRQSVKSFSIWTLCIAGFVAMCIFMFPSMKGEMDKVGEMFASMGGFSAAFGLDRLNFGRMIGFYATACGNILGLGAALFAALLGVNSLSKEENDHTAEFLLTLPVSRPAVIGAKLLSMIIQIVALNVVCTLVSMASIGTIGESVEWKCLLLLNLSYLLVHIELGCIGIAVSAFSTRSNAGIGIAIAVALYFLNIVANISPDAKPLKYLTPFAFAEGADIIANVSLDTTLVVIGMTLALVSTILAFVKYSHKDIRA